MDNPIASNKQSHITEGPIVKTLVTLATPLIIGMFMEIALSVTHYFWVGKLGPIAQDAITTSMIVIWTMVALTSIVSVGITALVSRNVGAGNIISAAYFVKQGLALAVILGLVFGIVGSFFTKDVLKFMHAGEETVTLGVPYLRIFFGAVILLFLLETSYAALRASGNTKTPAYIGIMVVIVNLILDPLFIFGIGPFPELGVTGAGVATTIAYTIGVFATLTFIYKGKLGYQAPRFRPLELSITDMYKIIKIGLPMSGHQLVFMMVYWFLIIIIHEFGEAAGAAMGIGNRMESLSYMICHGISLAASAMVGQNLGAGKADRAARSAWYGVGLGIIVTTIVSIIFLTFSRQIPAVFSNSPEVIHIARDYLIILALSQMSMAVEIVLEGSFAGAGDTVPPMLVMLPGHLVRIPLAYYLCFTLGLGINGVWWTLTITTTIKAIILAFWFRRGKWKEKVI
jgi:putative MATE family efflux protein